MNATTEKDTTTSTTVEQPVFHQIGDAAVATQKRGDGLWNHFAKYVDEVKPDSLSGEELKAKMSETLKHDEKVYRKMHPKTPKLGTIGAYRSAKSVILAAIEQGISLVDGEGKVRGKTEIEKQLKELKVEKTPMEKFRLMHSSLSAIASVLTDSAELKEAAQLVEDLYAKVRILAHDAAEGERQAA